MNDQQRYVRRLFDVRKVKLHEQDENLFGEFVQDELVMNAVQQILDAQQLIMDKWQLKKRIEDISRQSISIPNGTVGKPYEARLDFIKLGWNDIVYNEIEGLEPLGLAYDATTELITGTPTQSGDLKLVLKFRLDEEPEDAALHERTILLIINPNARLLWKNEPSNREDPFWKPDTATTLALLTGDRTLVAASGRGRSHANTGGFRDDDFAYKSDAATGWNMIAVADGAGSAKLAREGSRLACAAAVDYFDAHLTKALVDEFESLLTDHLSGSNETAAKAISNFVYEHLSKAAFYVHQQLTEKAMELNTPLKDFHTTLAFTLFKKYTDGYAFLAFGVGDSPMAVLSKDGAEVTLLSTLDVGTYGGGTRFITMPEIFQPDSLMTRFRFKWMPDFSYLFLMTDGIYDPKFSVEAALAKPEKWKELMADLQGENEDGVAVHLTAQNAEIQAQLASWLNFWSPGNHDDRTLVIVF